MLSLYRAKKKTQSQLFVLKSLLIAIFRFFLMSNLTLRCCSWFFDIASNFLVATSINSWDTCIPTISLFAIASSIWACEPFNIFIEISYSYSSFTSSLLNSSSSLSSIFFFFFLLDPALKIYNTPLQVVPFPIFLTASVPLLPFLLVLYF